MPTELVLLVLTAALAVIAVVAALVAVRASRKSPAPVVSPAAVAPTPAPTPTPAPSTDLVLPEVPVARIVEGRVIVTPTTREIVDATMSRPLVRISVVSHGLAHALRPESRDRIVALMRREFRARRRQRRRAAKQAARMAHPTPPPAIDSATIETEAWLGELPPVRHGVIEP